MIQRQTLALVVIAVCITLAGCSDGSLVSDETESEDGGAGSGDWCTEEESMEWSNPQTGEMVSLTINGTTTYEGKEVCVGSWETNDPDSEAARIVYMFTEDEEFTRIVTYDENGEILSEIESSGGFDTGNGSDSSASTDWCQSGQSFTSSSPGSGEQVSFTYEGIVTQDGREVCKAVWEAADPDGEVARTEYYFDEEGTYTRWVSYDEDGNVVNEFESTADVGSDTGSNSGTASDWCPTGQSFTSSIPQTGDIVEFNYEGIVTQDGRELCKATWQTDDPDGEIVRTEYYFDEEGTYTRWVSYDEDGNVVDEQTIDASEFESGQTVSR